MGIEGLARVHIQCYMQKVLVRRSIGEIIAENRVGEEYWQQLMRWQWDCFHFPNLPLESISATHHGHIAYGWINRLGHVGTCLLGN